MDCFQWADIKEARIYLFLMKLLYLWKGRIDFMRHIPAWRFKKKNNIFGNAKRKTTCQSKWRQSSGFQTSILLLLFPVQTWGFLTDSFRGTLPASSPISPPQTGWAASCRASSVCSPWDERASPVQTTNRQNSSGLQARGEEEENQREWLLSGRLHPEQTTFRGEVTPLISLSLLSSCYRSRAAR